MNTHELRTRSQKTETRTEKKLRKAETNLRFSAQPETKTSFTNDLRQFSPKNKNSLKQPPHTTIVDFCRAWPLLSHAERISSKTPAIPHIPPNPISESRVFPGCSHLCPFAFFAVTKPLQSRAVAPTASITALSRRTNPVGTTSTSSHFLSSRSTHPNVNILTRTRNVSSVISSFGQRYLRNSFSIFAPLSANPTRTISPLQSRVRPALSREFFRPFPGVVWIFATTRKACVARLSVAAKMLFFF